jgi:ABC-2 type transport system ATP-binding protein
MLRRLSEKKTIILSTHILSEIEAICERVIIIKRGSIVANDTIQNLAEKYSDNYFIGFNIEANNLLEVETELANVKGAWKVEFEKKAGKNIFKFKALILKDSEFESNLQGIVSSKKWKLTNFEKNKANLEEIFLKLTNEEEDND